MPEIWWFQIALHSSESLLTFLHHSQNTTDTIFMTKMKQKVATMHFLTLAALIGIAAAQLSVSTLCASARTAAYLFKYEFETREVELNSSSAV